MKKFELTSDVRIIFGKKLFRIKALVKFGNVEEGDLGGYIEKEENLSHEGNAWVYGDARVYGNAWVYGDAWVSGNAEVYGNARVYGDARVYGNARVYGDAWVSGNAEVYGDAWVSGNADYAMAKGFGTAYRNTTFFKCEDGKVRVTCGCFYGTLDEFRKQVKKTRKGKIKKEYLMLADLMEYHFSKEK